MHRRVLLRGLVGAGAFWQVGDALAQTTARASGPAARPAVPPRVIAIDAGHGGKDPGAIGVRGTHEKELTIAVAKDLARRLQTNGRYRVILTRNDDSFVTLGDRVKIARERRAELFISLHADSVQNPQTRGFSVYTLSETASDDLAGALATSQNAVDRLAGIDLTKHSRQVRNILVDLMHRDTANASNRMAQSLLDSFAPPFSPIQRPHRQANFAVLRAPDIPSILVEMGFISNAEDERALQQRSTQTRISERLVLAVDGFFAARRV
ncbi:MAG: N-acetylmuramoyl-L-alanine amidase [Alphaproteobacteria bacterium]|nr:N-acetylmuramoyl-L-alanine amidase [Alphaproteobacteria bacterium]TAD87371.1 MAG: N-acetylmuramoyl-L-alanine amidase [Alphaproteobacteria bacterium]